MNNRTLLIIALTCIAVLAGMFVYSQSSTAAGKQVVGVWFVTFPDAPFKYHMVTFHQDGTMEQANPDAGDAHTSDSDGMGVWEMRGGKVVGKFVEITADRTTRQFVARGEISFTLDVNGSRFTGTAVGRFYDLNEKLVAGPINTEMNGTKVGL
jgi:hypothetical protein